MTNLATLHESTAALSVYNALAKIGRAASMREIQTVLLLNDYAIDDGTLQVAIVNLIARGRVRMQGDKCEAVRQMRPGVAGFVDRLLGRKRMIQARSRSADGWF